MTESDEDLKGQLRSTERKTRIDAARSLAWRRPPWARAALLGALPHERDWRVRAEIILSLGVNGDSRDIELLETVALGREPGGDLHYSATLALASLRSIAAVPALERVLRLGDKGQQGAAVRGLGRIDGSEADAALRRARGHPRRSIRARAAWLLWRRRR